MALENLTAVIQKRKKIRKNKIQSLDNSFFELWLPRNLEAATLQMEYQGKVATAEISTKKGALHV